MTVPERTCPYCDTLVPEDTTVCPGCGEDVAGLLHLAYAHVIYYNEALDLARQGALEQAQDSLLLSLRLRPTYVPSLTLMARLAARERRWAEARDYAARAKALANRDPELDALIEAIDEAEAESMAAQQAQETDQVRERRAAAGRFLATRQRELLQAVLVGTVLGGILSQAARWLISRAVGREG